MPDSSYPSIGKSHFVATIFAGVDGKGLKAYKGRVNETPIDNATTANTDQGETSKRGYVVSIGGIWSFKSEQEYREKFGSWKNGEWQKPTETTQYVDAA